MIDRKRAFERQLTERLELMAGPEPAVDAMSSVRAAIEANERHRFATLFGLAKFAVAAAIVLLFGGLLLASFLVRPSDTPLVGSTPSPSVFATPSVTDVIEVGSGGLGPAVAAGDAVWVLGADEISRIDPATREVTESIALGTDPAWLLPTDDAIWVVHAKTAEIVDVVRREVRTEVDLVSGVGPSGDEPNPFQEPSKVEAPIVIGATLWYQMDTVDGGFIVEVDPASGEKIEYALPEGTFAAWWSEVMDGALWSYHPDGHITRFDLAAREFDEPVPVDVSTPRECCITADGAVWLVDGDSLVPFDVESAEPGEPIEIDGGIRPGIAVAGAIWLPDPQDGVVRRFDLETRMVSHVIPVGSRPGRPAWAEGALWVPNAGDGTVSRIDPVTTTVTQSIEVGGEPGTPLAFDGAIWVPDAQGGTVTRITSGATGP